MKTKTGLLILTLVSLGISSCSKPISSSDNSESHTSSDASSSSNQEPVAVYFKVDFVNYDNTLIKTIQVKKGEKAVFNSDTPKREKEENDTSGYNYVFTGWDKSLDINITENTTFKAQYEEMMTVGTKGLIYNYVNDGDVEPGFYVTEYNGTDTDVVIQTKYQGYDVIGISNNAFEGNEKIEKVLIPDSVKMISELAFAGCSHLKTVVFSKNIKEIGQSAFVKCSSLNNVALPDETVSISELCFLDCVSLTTLTFGDNLQNISDKALKNTPFETEKKALLTSDKKSVYITSRSGNNKILYLTDGTSITSFEIDNDTDAIASNAFDKVTLSSLTVPSSVRYLSDYTFQGSLIASVNLSDSKIEKLSSYCFYFCGNLTDVSLPEGLKEVGENAFDHATSLSAITLPNSVERIEQNAFNSCTKLTTLNVGNNISFIGERVFSNTNLLALEKNTAGIKYLVSSDKSVKYLVGVSPTNSIPATYSLDPKTVLIYGGGLSNQINLTTLTLPEGLKYICGSLVQYNDPLSSLNLPASLKTISDEVFQNATSVKTVTVAEGNTEFSAADNILYNKDKTKLLWCPASATNDIVVPATVKTVGQRSFYHRTLNSLTLGKNVRLIEDGVFTDCKINKSITLNDGLELIGNSAFDYTRVSTIVIPDTVTAMGEGSIQANAESVTISSKMTVLPNDFYGISDRRIVIPSNIEAISSRAFSQCYDIPELFIPNSVTTYGKNAFSTEISKYIVDQTNKYLSSYEDELYNADKTVLLSSVPCTSSYTVKEGVKELGDYAFAGSKLTSITLASTTTKLDSFVFSECEKLETFVSNKEVTEIGTRCFSSNTSLTGTLDFRDSLKWISRQAFNDLNENPLTYIISDTVTYMNEDAFNSVTGNIYFENTAAQKSWNANPINELTGKSYYYSDTSKTDSWHYDKDSNPVLW